MQRIHFKFLEAGVSLESDWPELVGVLSKDFWSFAMSTESSSTFKLKIVKSNMRPDFPVMKATFQNQNAIVYDVRNNRYCDYYGEAFATINFKTNEAVIFSDNFEKAHEVAYLMILSRVGKKLDLMGFHKIHAFAISFKGKALVCMMPSKGGKSTLLMELLKDDRVKMLSDDIPLIGPHGFVYSFPLKLGLNTIPESLKINNRDENIYQMNRTHYGVKNLVCTRGLDGKVEKAGTAFSNVILLSAQRYNEEKSIINSESWPSSFKGLFLHGVIGLGTPMVLEYFWENGINDFLVKTKIFFLRLSRFFFFSLKSTKLNISLGRNPELAARQILNYLENKNNSSSTGIK
ncbi:MAG: hypothetical protein H7177_09725 [Rhizobacter sp.]|nr:hypothetical protein [Bacteriovorax sp.]